jgi:hypothetical protein
MNPSNYMLIQIILTIGVQLHFLERGSLYC